MHVRFIPHRTLRLTWLVGAFLLPVAVRADPTFREDWESGGTNWSAPHGVWEIGTPTMGPSAAHGGSRCAGTVLDGNYPGPTDARLMGPWIDLGQVSGDERIILSFWQWFSLSWPDTARVEIRREAGPWEPVSSSFVRESPTWTRYAVDLSARAGTRIQLGFRLVSHTTYTNLGWYVDDVMIETRPVPFPDPESFESGTGDWYAEGGVWQVGVPTIGPSAAHGGSQCAGTVLDGNYPGLADARLVSPWIDLGPASRDQRIVLGFWQWFSLSWPDTARVEIRRETGPWEPVSSSFVKESPTWTRYAVDLTPDAGARIQLGFRLVSHHTYTNLGWYVDDIVIETRPVSFLNPESFESGTGDWYAEGGVWQVGVPTIGPNAAHGGSQCAGTVLDGNYPGLADARLVSPRIFLRRSTPDDSITLSFFQWFALSWPDSIAVEIRAEDGQWRRITAAYGGQSHTWTRMRIDLSAFAGLEIQLGFRMMSHSSFTDAGWYIDDVAIEGVGTALRATLGFAVTTAGSTATRGVFLNNLGRSPLLLAPFSIRGGAFALPPSFADSLDQGIEISPGTVLQVPFQFTPPDSGAFVGDANILRVDPPDTIACVHLTGRGRALQFALFYPDRDLQAGEDLPVEVIVAESVATDSIQVLYAPGGAPSYHIAVARPVELGPVHHTCRAVVPAAAVGVRGVNLYATAFNGTARRSQPAAGNPIHFRVAISNLEIPVAPPAGVYALVSIPLDLPNNTIVGVLGDDLGAYEATRWRAFSYEASTGAYEEAPYLAFERGRSYWLISREATRLDTAPASGISTRASNPYNVLLEPGWNLIGNPFAFRVAWNAVVADGLPVAEDSLIERPVAWDASASPPTYVGQQEILEPFCGYWVRNGRASRVLLAIPQLESLARAQGTMGTKARGPTVVRAADSWSLRLAVRSARACDTWNEIGVSEDASVTWDPQDQSEPPLNPGRSLTLYFPHGDWGEHNGRYAVDIRATRRPAGDRNSRRNIEDRTEALIWYFDIARGQTEDGGETRVLLEVEGLDSPRPEERVLLIDRGLGRVWDLKSEPRYWFELESRGFVATEAECRFAVFLGDGQFADSLVGLESPRPRVTRLHPSIPNPFNPSTRVRCEIGDAGVVDLTIFDARGRLVRTLYRGQANAGDLEVPWDGTDGVGRSVASGAYLLRLQATGAVHLQKLTLVR